MKALRRFVARLASLAARRARDERLREEIEEHLALQTAENLRSGLPPAEARRQAVLKFGAVEAVKEEYRAGRALPFVETFLQDLRYSIRMLRKSPGFTAAAVLTLAVGMGANTAIFSIVNSVLLEPLRYPDSRQLVALHQTAPGAAGLANFSEGLPLSPSMFLTYAERNRTFQSLGVWTMGTASVTGMAQPEQVRTVGVSDGVLEALDVPPLIGRWLSAADQIPRSAQTVMLGYGYWQQRFGGDPSVIGRDLIVDSRPREIVGVMPNGFRIVDANPGLILPLAFDRSKLILAGFGYDGIARLKPGVTIAQADADVARIIPIWMHSWSNGPGTDPMVYLNWRITPAIRPLKREVVGNVANVLWVVMATLGIVLLIACANVANLLLVKVEARRQELAVRAVLGAPVARIVRELLLECLILGLMGGIAGLALARGGLRLLVAMGPANLPRLSEISLGSRALVFTLVLSLLSALLFGSIAALKHARPAATAGFRGGSRTSTASRERHRARNALVVVQVAMSFVLLVSAGLMIRTLRKLREVDPGFTDARRLQLVRISIPPSLVPQPERVVRIQNDIGGKLGAIPGVTSVGFASEMPMEGFAPDWDEIAVQGRNYPGDAIPPLYLYEFVSPGFFHTLGTRILAGRELTWNDVYNLRPVGLVSENLAREMWGSPSRAIGRQFREFSGEPWRRVIGVVQDLSEDGVNKKAPEIVYWPTLDRNLYGPEPVDAPLDSVRTVTFAVRSGRAGRQTFLGDIRRAVWSVNASLPLASVRTMQDVYNQSLAQSSFALVMLAIAATMALALGVVGIYGVVSYVVGQGRHEIGIRMALGAVPADILSFVLGEGGKLAAGGIGLGLLASLGLARFMASILFGVSANDPLTLVVVVFVLFGVVLLACSIPALKAMRVDPVVALRYE